MKFSKVLYRHRMLDSRCKRSKPYLRRKLNNRKLVQFWRNKYRKYDSRQKFDEERKFGKRYNKIARLHYRGDRFWIGHGRNFYYVTGGMYGKSKIYLY